MSPDVLSAVAEGRVPARRAASTDAGATDQRTALRGLMPVRDVSLNVDVIGRGYPLVLMHGGPSADLWTMQPFRRLVDRFTLVFYDHRCNGRSEGAPVSSMTWDNLAADADALRERLGFERWAVLGHSFGGQVALEYALQYPDRVSHLVLLDTGPDSQWAREKAPRLLAERGYDAKKVALVRRWFHGEFTPKEYWPIFLRIGGAYWSKPSLLLLLRMVLEGGWRSRSRPEALIFAGRSLMTDWTVKERLDHITAPTLVMAGREDFIFPPECQRELVAAIPHARLHLVDHAGHSPHDEQTDEVLLAVTTFMGTDPRTF
jgi:proline iminopeptidase